MKNLLLSILFFASVLSANAQRYELFLSSFEGRWNVKNKCTAMTCDDPQAGETYVGKPSTDTWTITMTSDLLLVLRSSNPSIGTVEMADYDMDKGYVRFEKSPLIGADQAIRIYVTPSGRLRGNRKASRPGCNASFAFTASK